MTEELIAWLRAQLDEDERLARQAFADHNNAGPDWREQWSGALNIGDDEDLVLTNDSQVSRFMEAFDPARVLAEVEAKRRILDEIVDEANGIDLSVDMDRRVGIRDETVEPCLGDRLVRLLAQPYAGREGWLEKWSVNPKPGHGDIPLDR